MKPTKYDVNTEQMLMNCILDSEMRNDLEAFVRFVYPWGKKGTPLERHKGPRAWQIAELNEMTKHIQLQQVAMDLGQEPRMWRKATAAGRGIGKSALVSWLTHWMLSTRIGSTVIVAANSESQLKGKTFAEMTKWLTLAENGHWFEASVMGLAPAPWFGEIAKSELKRDTGYYYAKGELWREENPGAFAGVHNPQGLMVLFDEAAEMPAELFSVTEGFFTDVGPDRFWNIYSNPRRKSGGFYDCFHNEKTRARWRLLQIDRRTVEGQDVAETAAELEQYGADSDHARHDIYGQFPLIGEDQFIANQLVKDAQERPKPWMDQDAPLILGIDVARHSDKTVLRWRQGLDARSIPPVSVVLDLDISRQADIIAGWIDRTAPDAVNIDKGNIGHGVIDLLRGRRYKINAVGFGDAAVNSQWAFKRTEMYADLREWLREGGVLDNHYELFQDLTAAEYRYHGKAGDKIILEPKEDLKSRLGRSPDHGDALALTFAVKVSRRRRPGDRGQTRVARDVDYPIFS